jgi:hypothetical protein
VYPNFVPTIVLEFGALLLATNSAGRYRNGSNSSKADADDATLIERIEFAVV